MLYAGERILEGSSGSVLKPMTQQKLSEMQSQFGNSTLNDRESA